MNPDFLLGRERVTVEIDESKFPCFTDPGSESNSRNIILDDTKMDKTWYTLVLNFGPTVISDGWISYLGLDQIRCLHLIVNHSQTFFELTTEAHTNIIEGNWMHARATCLQREKENGYIEAIFWNISIASNSTKVPTTKAFEDF
ncbi:hypothetical protein RF11_00017 [Thelohanellus kitauei]|uniref:ISXO2-like transposase domain-containing protein n=1 Tax=Thelohanellus kitauei TaxID=669202 RepID=A0A0C2JX40_THEKT|nr:hypothetical protein RF11_00017 [Thelohanellus kitauei]